MPRRARASVANVPHLVYQRSFGARVLFSTDKDRAAYLQMLQRQASKHRTDILAYCLMKNYVHIVAVPHKKGGLAKAVGRTHYDYTNYLNSRKGLAGQLWRGRFQSCMLDAAHVPIAAQHVECQPVYQKVVRKAEKYRWSSAQTHVTGKDEFDVLMLKGWPSKYKGKRWAAVLAKALDQEMREKLRMYTQTGRPVGSARFVSGLEKKLRRRLHALPVGRPRKD